MGFLKKLKHVFVIILKLVAIAAALVLVGLVLAPIVTAIASAIATVIPHLVAAVAALGKWVWGIGAKIVPVVKKGINAVSVAYENWVKPTLVSVENAVKAIHDAIHKTYSLTIGAVTNTYNTLFGWTDGVRKTIFDITTKLSAVVSVVDEKAAKKIRATGDDIIGYIDKYTKDIFDKAINKINEVAGPILKKVDDVTATFTNRIDYITGITDDINSVLNDTLEAPTVLTEDTTVHTFDAHREVYDETVTGQPTVPEKSETEAVRKIDLDELLDKNVIVIKYAEGRTAQQIERGQDEVIQQFKGEKLDWEFTFDDDVVNAGNAGILKENRIANSSQSIEKTVNDAYERAIAKEKEGLK